MSLVYICEDDTISHETNELALSNMSNGSDFFEYFWPHPRISCCSCFYYPAISVINWVVVLNILYFNPYLGKIPILTNIFQRG